MHVPVDFSFHNPVLVSGGFKSLVHVVFCIFLALQGASL